MAREMTSTLHWYECHIEVECNGWWGSWSVSREALVALSKSPSTLARDMVLVIVKSKCQVI